MDKRELDEHGILCAEIAISKFFEVRGASPAPAKEVTTHCKQSGLQRMEVREARKRIGIHSVKDGNGVYLWHWPDDKDPEVVNTQKSRKLMEEIENERM